jgi:peptidoglycan/LPS O-acetylase OafA/YrhL
VSGFVMFLPTVGRGRFGSVRAYAVRRAGRILPPYYLSLAVALAVRPLVSGHVHLAQGPHDMPAVLAHLVFMQLELFPFSAGFGTQGVIWTLSVSVLFYALLPLVAERFLRRPAVGLLAGVALALAWRQLANPMRSGDLFLQFPLFAGDYAIGMAAAWMYVRLRLRAASGSGELTRQLALPVFGGALAALLLLFHTVGDVLIRRGMVGFFNESMAMSVLVPLVFAVLVVASAFTPRWAQWPLANRASRWLGEVSYGIFLYHFMITLVALWLLRIPANDSPLSLLELAAVVLPATLLMAWLSAAFYEQPLRERARRLARRVQERSRLRPMATGTHDTALPALAASPE